MTTASDRPVCVLGIDTSNYTTSAACSRPVSGLHHGGFLMHQKKQLLTVKKGERGLRQSDALFAHTVNLPKIIEALFEELPEHPEIAAVAYSARPRPVEGSYMPCFLAGEATARSIAAVLGVPVYSFSHQEGHIAAAAYSAAQNEDTFSHAPFLAFHVSGGTTDLLHVTPAPSGYRITQIGTSLDLNAGQAIDRTGVMLGLTFPCGPALEQLAAACTVRPPAPKICVRGCDCNLSGLENLTAKLLSEGAAPETIAAFAFAFIGKTLAGMTEHALERFPHHPVLFAGGVMSNHLMRASLAVVCEASGAKAYFSEPVCSADNAVGVSLLGCRAFLSRSL